MSGATLETWARPRKRGRRRSFGRPLDPQDASVSAEAAAPPRQGPRRRPDVVRRAPRLQKRERVMRPHHSMIRTNASAASTARGSRQTGCARSSPACGPTPPPSRGSSPSTAQKRQPSFPPNRCGRRGDTSTCSPRDHRGQRSAARPRQPEQLHELERAHATPLGQHGLEHLDLHEVTTRQRDVTARSRPPPTTREWPSCAFPPHATGGTGTSELALDACKVSGSGTATEVDSAAAASRTRSPKTSVGALQNRGLRAKSSCERSTTRARHSSFVAPQ
jgi:hypothetical protein